MRYDFNYKDNEGDEFQSNDHPSEAAARKEIKKLKERYDGDFRVTESWKYDDQDNYRGSWY